MSENDYLKCRCQKCGGRIEFPRGGIGEMAECPHCGEQVRLVSTRAWRGGKKITIAGSALIFSILAGAGVMLHWPKKPDVIQPNMVAQTVTNAPVPETFTEVDEFNVGTITLKKTEGSGLVYAVGKVKNDTARQRFGVKIELDLLDAQENKIGSASDYIEVLEPGKEWKFRALLTDPKAVRAKVIKIEEQK
jgi:hypothetical protein